MTARSCVKRVKVGSPTSDDPLITMSASPVKHSAVVPAGLIGGLTPAHPGGEGNSSASVPTTGSRSRPSTPRVRPPPLTGHRQGGPRSQKKEERCGHQRGFRQTPCEFSAPLGTIGPWAKPQPRRRRTDRGPASDLSIPTLPNDQRRQTDARPPGAPTCNQNSSQPSSSHPSPLGLL